MKIKRILCAALSVAMLSGGALGVDLKGLPVGPGPAEMPKFEVARRNDNAAIMVWGAVKEKGEGYVYLENSNEEAANAKIIVKINEDTAVVDAVTGAAKTFADLKENETLYAWVSPAMTRSMPPQTNAFVVVCNIPADYGVPMFAQVHKVNLEDDGSTRVLVSNSVLLRLNEETQLMSYKTKDVPTLADIKPGTMVLSWYRMMALSLPAQATPTKVMVFPYSYAGYVSALPGELTINGAKVALESKEAPFVHEEKLMVPLRKFAENLGATVTWNAATPDAVLVEKDGVLLYLITVGAETMLRNGEVEVSMATPGQARDGVTFVCLDDLLIAHNVKAETRTLLG